MPNILPCGKKQLGLGDTVNRYIPTKLNIVDILSISCGEEHTLVLTNLGEIFGFGRSYQLGLCEIVRFGNNYYGQLGLDDENINVPTKLNIMDVKSISCGGCHSLVLTNSGDIFVVGANYYGRGKLPNILPFGKSQLGLGHNENVNVPTKLNFPHELYEPYEKLCKNANK